MNLHRIALAALALAVVSAATPAHAQYAVHDASNIAKTAELLSVNGQQLGQLNNIYSSVDLARQAIGNSGSFSFGGLMPSLVNVLSQQAPVFGANTIRVPAGRSYPPTTTDVGVMRQWTSDTLYVPPANALDGKTSDVWGTQVSTARNDALRRAALDGYALANTVRQNAAQTPDVTNGLRSNATAALNLRSDVKANTQVNIAMLEQSAQQTALLAALLEIEAAKVIQGDRLQSYTAASE